MDTRSNDVVDLWTLAGEISTPSEARVFFTRLMQEIGLNSDPVPRSMLNTGLQSLIERTKENSANAEEIIDTYILPLCLEETSLLSPELLEPWQARELLRNWVGQYPDETRMPLRARLLQRILHLTDREPSVAAIKTVGAVGFRSLGVERLLIRIFNQPGTLGDAAIDALCALSASKSVQTRLVDHILRRDPHGRGTRYDYAIQELASPKFIPALRERLLSNPDQPWHAASLLGHIADELPGDVTVQNRVWRVFYTALNHGIRVITTGNTISNCNSRRVIPALLKRIEEPGFSLHVIASHLRDCVRPEQLEGWHTASKADLKRRLTKYVTVNVANQTRSLTVEDHMRRLAWDTAFCAGITDISDWLFASGEDSPYALSEVFAFASFVVLPKWPAIVNRLVIERVDLRTGNNIWLAARTAAAQLIASSETIEALTILVDCGLTADSAPLVSVVELVGDLVDCLTSKRSGHLVEYLFRVSEDLDRVVGRMSGIVGIQRLTAAGAIPNDYLERVINLAMDQSLPSYARAAVIWVAASFPLVKARGTFIEYLTRLVDDGLAHEELRFQSVQALIQLDIWKEHKPTILRALGVRSGDNRIEDSQLQRYVGWQSYALGLLVTRDPEAFLPAAKQLIEAGSGQVVHLLLQALDRSSLGKDNLAELGRSAIHRSRRVLARSFGETDNFKVLTRLVPLEFITTKWESYWAEWMPQVRAALADALQEHAEEESASARSRKTELLEGLLGDSTHLVRRVAARTYSRIDRDGFLQLCRDWSRSGQTELRLRAAEGAQWISPDDVKTLDNSLLRNLLHDPEPSVRSAARRSAGELRKAEWRSAVLLHMKSRDWSDREKWLGDCYCYGRALVALGDDETGTELRRLMQQRKTPMNIRNWLKRLIDELDEHWREVTRKWPEPVSAWSGQLEELESDVIVGERKVTSRISLWLRRQGTPTEKTSWGGALVVPSLKERMDMALHPIAEAVRLSIPGRETAKIWWSGSVGDEVLFLGTGPYPHPTEPISSAPGDI
jgi:hypothetical protein